MINIHRKCAFSVISMPAFAHLSCKANIYKTFTQDTSRSNRYGDCGWQYNNNNKNTCVWTVSLYYIHTISSTFLFTPRIYNIIISHYPKIDR